MSRGITVSAEPGIIEIEDEVADFAADLLALEEHEFVLEYLFKRPAGKWCNLVDFITDDHPIVQKITSLQSDCHGQLKVTWIEHPDLESGYCFVVFYVDSLNWNSLALYNKDRLQRSQEL